jgi:hypothetical protein
MTYLYPFFLLFWVPTDGRAHKFKKKTLWVFGVSLGWANYAFTIKNISLFGVRQIVCNTEHSTSLKKKVALLMEVPNLLVSPSEVP